MDVERDQEIERENIQTRTRQLVCKHIKITAGTTKRVFVANNNARYSDKRERKNEMEKLGYKSGGCRCHVGREEREISSRAADTQTRGPKWNKSSNAKTKTVAAKAVAT